MKQAERDIDQLHSILHYCRRIEAAMARFGKSFNAFEHDDAFQDCCSLCIIQIGEAVNRLSQEFVAEHPEIDWRRIYGMRCHLVHGYQMFDAEIVWDAIETHIPALSAFCEQVLTDES